jgi:hypothetical protein
MIRLDEDSQVYFYFIISLAFEINKRILSILTTEIFELLKTQPNFFSNAPSTG